MAAGHVLLKGIVKIENVVLGEDDFAHVALQDFDVLQAELLRRLARGHGQIRALLDPGEVRISHRRGDETELPRAAPDIEHAEAGRGYKQPRR